MKRSAVFRIAFQILLVSTTSLAWAQDSERVWDQEKAKEMVEDVMATEKKGLMWDKVRWSTDVDATVDRARKSNKPIFVFWYLKKGGPAEAPC